HRSRAAGQHSPGASPQLQAYAADRAEGRGEYLGERAERALARAAVEQHSEVLGRRVPQLVYDLGGDVAGWRERAEDVAQVARLDRLGDAWLFGLDAQSGEAAGPSELIQPQWRLISVGELHGADRAHRGEREGVVVDGQAVVVALDARCVERAQEDAVGAHERSRDHGDVRVGLLDRRIGGAQQRGVAGGLFGAGEELFVGVVGLVPDLDRGKVRPVALGQVGDERRVLVRVARRI